MAPEMTYDREAGAAYIHLSQSRIDDTVILETSSITLDINLDVDAANRPVGVELLGLAQAEPEQLLRAIASGYVADLLAAAGYEIPRLRGNPAISVRHIS
ncbi:DUF2283 domain-containing protein [Paeniglutamicibacter sp. NPDC012692]|uniref:DUF2283 domain-containing protein n=1 Tax=Paeniglutamicibacter sp. NPDC012692 TaxID=3364388 RepID=UPI00369AAF70